MAITSLYLIFTYFSFLGLGYFFSKFILIKNNFEKPLLTRGHYFILGLFFSSFILQIYHLFFKISFYFPLITFFLGFLFLIPNIKKEKFSTFFPFLLFIPFLSIFLIGEVELYDSGLYHLQNILWNFEAPLIHGLTNLHERFGFSHNLFLFNSFFFPFKSFPEGFNISNGLFILIWFSFVFQEFQNFNSGKEKYSTFFCFLSALPLYYFLRKQGHSPGAELPLNIFILVIFYLLIKFYEDEKNNLSSNVSLGLAYLLSTIGLSFKLTILPIYLFTFFLMVYRFFNKRFSFFSKSIFVFGIIYLLIWSIRTFLISGCLLFPISQTCFPHYSSWATPISSVENSLRWVKSWARIPKTSPDIVLSSWSWFASWIVRILKDSWGILLYIFFSFSFISFSPSEKKMSIGKIIEPLLILNLICITYWFFTAPDIRFGKIFLFLLALIPSSFLFGQIQHHFSNQNNVFFNRIPFYLFFAIIFFIPIKKIRKLTFSSLGTIKKTKVEIWQIKNGVSFYKPQEGDQCWIAPLPCSPSSQNNLEVSLENKIIKSFYIK